MRIRIRLDSEHGSITRDYDWECSGEVEEKGKKIEEMIYMLREPNDVIF